MIDSFSNRNMVLCAIKGAARMGNVIKTLNDHLGYTPVKVLAGRSQIKYKITTSVRITAKKLSRTPVSYFQRRVSK
jgi:hypothetical protein